MAGRAVSAVFSAGSVDVGGGVSNTPHSDVCKGSITNIVSNRVGIVNTCVDYLKIRFDGSFEKGDPRWVKLWGILRVDPSLFVERSGASGYLHGFDIEEGLSWFWGGAFTKSAIGEETCLMVCSKIKDPCDVAEDVFLDTGTCFQNYKTRSRRKGGSR